MEGLKTGSGLKYVVDHVFLPPQVPTQDDSSEFSQRILLNVVIDGLKKFQAHHVGEDAEIWSRCALTIERLLKVHKAEGGLVKDDLLNMFKDMKSGGKDFYTAHYIVQLSLTLAIFNL